MLLCLEKGDYLLVVTLHSVTSLQYVSGEENVPISGRVRNFAGACFNITNVTPMFHRWHEMNVSWRYLSEIPIRLGREGSNNYGSGGNGHRRSL